MKAILSLSLLWLPFANAITCSPHNHIYVQPDGTNITVVGHGDENSNRESDVDGYTVLADDQGYLVYAEKSPDGGLVPSSKRVGKFDPKGMAKNLMDRSPRDCSRMFCGGLYAQAFARKKRPSGERHLLEEDPGPEVHGRRTVSTTGTLKNLVVLLKFKDHQEQGRVLPSESDIAVLMNSDDPDALLAPTGSLKGVYLENSYGKLTIESTVTPWFVTPQTESEYAGGNSGLSTTLHGALRSALDYLDDNNIIDFNEFDQDNDGYIDAITFLHSGYGAEWQGNDSYGTSYQNRIWSHKWALFSPSAWVSKDGNVRVYNYHISPAVWRTSGDAIGRVGVIAHEMGHFLGLPDLYDTTNNDGSGLGSYGLMANCWGFDGTQYHPPHMSAWSKLRMGWITAQTPSYGVNTIANAEEITSETQIYKIGDGQFGFPVGEYLLIENRQPKGLEDILPQGGLAIYHIDDTLSDYSDQGYPGQDGWPGNGKHYRVALLQADGSYDLEHGYDRGDKWDVFHGDNVNYLGPDGTSINAYPNTDSYKGGNIVKTDIQIFDISSSGDNMAFSFTDGTTTSPTTIPTTSPTSEPSSGPSSFPSSRPSTFPSSTSSSEPTSPTTSPTSDPSSEPSSFPSSRPSRFSVPSTFPSSGPSTFPSSEPSSDPSTFPSSQPSRTIRTRKPKKPGKTNQQSESLIF